MLNLPVYHLDNYYWLSPWVKNPSFDITSIISQDDWIIDGTYTNCCFEKRLEISDYIFYMDCNLLIRLWRMVRRHMMYLIAPTGKSPVSQKVNIGFVLSTIRKVCYAQPRILEYIRDNFPEKLQYIKGARCANLILDGIENEGFLKLLNTDEV